MLCTSIFFRGQNESQRYTWIFFRHRLRNYFSYFTVMRILLAIIISSQCHSIDNLICMLGTIRVFHTVRVRYIPYAYSYMVQPYAYGIAICTI